MFTVIIHMHICTGKSQRTSDLETLNNNPEETITSMTKMFSIISCLIYDSVQIYVFTLIRRLLENI